MSAWSIAIVLALMLVPLAFAWAKLGKQYETLQAQHMALQNVYELLQAEYQEARRILAFKSTLASRRDVSQREYDDSLHRLGFKSLAEYRRSGLWQQTKHRYRNSDYPQRCLVCGARDFDLHHRTYSRLGKEELFDLVPLCLVHHQRLHDLLDPNPGLCVKDTHDFLVLLREKQDAHPPQPGVQGGSLPEQPSGSRAGKPWSAE